jgi:hypothetical protein
MATSGDTTWTLNRDEVIKGALRKLGALASGGSPTTAQTTDAAEALNAIVKALHADGMPLWKITNTSFTVVDGTSQYTIGPTGCTVTAAQPLKVLQAFYTPTDGNNTPMNILTRYDFKLLPTSSDIEGDPVNLNYQPLRTTGVINLWPTPDNSTTSITIHYQAPYEDMDGATNDFDFPPYWIQALIYLLAWALSPEYGIPPTDRQLISKEALYWKAEALSYGSEEGSILFQPNSQG